MDMAQTIGGRIDELRHARDLSVADVAELIGVTRQTMSNYIAGRQVISSS
ncbi:MAG: helix-turn-helix transcriptional regulator, partial [Firmicutes bacterium]|nr:helix-turn-helix transcriptional regulator [Bacillota bacterium]